MTELKGEQTEGATVQQGDKPEDVLLDSREPVFDYAAMSHRLMDDEDLIRTVAETFLSDMREQIKLLKTAVADGDLPVTAAQSHKIKGSSANVGGLALSVLAYTMEQAGKAGDMETVRQGLPELDRCFSLLKAAMEKIL